jgi:hypothetical protein
LGLLRVKVRSEVSGRSFALDRTMSEVDEGSADLLSRVMTGRGAETVRGRERERPSRREMLAVRWSLT